MISQKFTLNNANKG